MALLPKIFLLFWIITGLIALTWGCRCMYNPKNRQKLKEQIKELSEDFEITEQDCISILYVGFVVFGFISVPLTLFRKWKKGLRIKK